MTVYQPSNIPVEDPSVLNIQKWITDIHITSINVKPSNPKERHE